MWRRTAVDEFWSRSHLTWWACANLSWALLHWNIVASQSSRLWPHHFRNETVNLISHDCQSVIPTYTSLWRMESRPAKGMVMAGEIAANDVDEEVYGNDGAERHEAQEASAGDRRAIADADQAGQLDNSGETRTARTRTLPNWKQWESLKVRRRLLQPMEKCKQRWSTSVCQRIWFIRDSEASPAVLSLGKLCEDHGYFYHWTSRQKPQLIKEGRRIQCNTANYVPIVVPGLSSSSASPTSPASLQQDSVVSTLRPETTRSENTSSQARGGLVARTNRNWKKQA